MRGSWTSSGLSGGKEEDNSKKHVLRKLEPWGSRAASPFSTGGCGPCSYLPGLHLCYECIGWSRRFLWGFPGLTVGILFCFNTHALQLQYTQQHNRGCAFLASIPQTQGPRNPH